MPGPTPRDFAERFEGLLIPDPMSGCWLFAGGVTPSGYGWVYVRPTGQRMEVAHRVAWQLYRGPIPEGLHVLHRCDVRRCCNPAHLFLGTSTDNMQDCSRKGRVVGYLKGEQHIQSRLTNVQVFEIRSQRDISAADLGRRYGIALPTVWGIRAGRSWKHLMPARVREMGQQA